MPHTTEKQRNKLSLFPQRAGHIDRQDLLSKTVDNKRKKRKETKKKKIKKNAVTRVTQRTKNSTAIALERSVVKTTVEKKSNLLVPYLYTAV